MFLDESADNDEDTSEELSASAIIENNFQSLPYDRDPSEEDEFEERLIREFAESDCGCSLGPNKSPCSQNITIDHYRSLRLQTSELTHDKLDLVILGQIMAGSFSSTTAFNKDRQKSYTHFYHEGARICLKTFLFLHSIGYFRFKALKASYSSRGMEPRQHKNKGRHTGRGLSFENVKGVIQFIMNYSGAFTVCCLHMHNYYYYSFFFDFF